MSKTIELVRQEIETIKNEVEDFANSASRIGEAMSDILEYNKVLTETEANRAKDAENVLNEAINAEKERAEEAEMTLAAAIAKNDGSIRGIQSTLEATTKGMLENADKILKNENAIGDLINSGYLYGGIASSLDFKLSVSENSRVFILFNMEGQYPNVKDGDVVLTVSKGEVWVAAQRYVGQDSFAIKRLASFADKDSLIALNNTLNDIVTRVSTLESTYTLAICESAADVAEKVVEIPNVPDNRTKIQGRRFIVRFRYKNTASEVFLTMGNQANRGRMFFNGAYVSATNTWEDNQRVELYYDNTSGWLAKPFPWYQNELTNSPVYAPTSKAVYDALQKLKSEIEASSGGGASSWAEMEKYKDTDGYLSENNDKYTIYKDGGGIAYTGILYDVQNVDKVKLSPVENDKTYSTYGFLVSDELVDGATAPYANGMTKTVKIDADMVVQVPSDAKYLWVYADRGSNDIRPSVEKEVAIDSVITELGNRVSSVEQEVKVLSSGGKDTIYAAVTLDATNAENRYNSMKQLLDVATGQATDVTLADKAAIIALPAHPAMFQGYDFNPIYAKNETVETLNASTTKVWTLAVGLDYIKDIKEVVTINSADVETGSGFDIQADDTCTIEALMYGMMLPSSNTCANAFARIAGEKICKTKGIDSPTPAQAKNEFIAEMNAKGEKIGFVNSSFDTPSGQSQTNKSCAIDLLRVIVEACSYNEILKVWGKPTYDVVIGGSNPRIITINVADSSARDSLKNSYDVLGFKTGSLYYTGVTAQALVMVAKIKE